MICINTKTRSKLSVFYFFCCIITFTSYHSPADPLKSNASIPHINESITVDGILDEEVWKHANIFRLNYQVHPGENVKPSVETTVKIFENGSTLFIAFIATDLEIDKMRSSLNRRDSALADDHVGIVLDTFNKQKHAFEILVNAVGAQMDFVYDEISGSKDSSWDGRWIAKSRIRENGYDTEIALPLQDLRFDDSLEKQIWGIDLIRFRSLSNESISLNKSNRNYACYLCQLKRVELFSNAKTKSHLEITPSIVAGRSESSDILDGNGTKNSSTADIGVDIKWRKSSSETLNVTINPDFSQIEADELQVDFNNNFSLFFEEKRPFFVENSDYFKTPIDVVYTRNIASPDIGFKYTAEKETSTLALLMANDESTSFILPSFDSSEVYTLDEPSTNTVVRYSRSISETTTAGLILTNRQNATYSNLLVGIDGNFQISEGGKLSYQILTSSTKNPQSLLDVSNGESEPVLAKHQLDFAGQLDYLYSRGNLTINGEYSAFGSNFRSDLGFVSQVGLNRASISSQYQLKINENTVFSEGFVSFSGENIKREDGQRLSNNFNLGTGLFIARSFFIELYANIGEEYFSGHNYRLHSMSSFAEYAPTAALQFGIGVNLGTTIDFENERTANELAFNPSVTWNINNHLEINLNYSHQTLSIKEGEIFNAKGLGAFLVYQFSNRTYLRLSSQNSCINLNPNLNLRSDEPDKFEELSCDGVRQLLFSHEIRPKTRFSIAYSDGAIKNSTIRSYIVANRSVFMKFTYAWEAF